MIGVLLAFALFGGIVAQDVAGVDYAGNAMKAACEAIGGKMDGSVVLPGGNKESKDARPKVPYCSAGPVEIVDIVKGAVGK